MSVIPPFFVPDALPEKQEELYTYLAKLCGKSALPMAERIYSMTYRHNGSEWTATVGESLSGTKSQIKRVRGQKTEIFIPVSDPAVVLAIFPGDPFFVVTNQGLAGNVRSGWTNPFMAGRPIRITRFAVSEE